MIRIRIQGEEIRLETQEWERWVEDGRIPPGAQVWIEGRGWAPAGVFSKRTRPSELRPAPLQPGVREVLFPRRGVSATELLLLANLVVAGVLVAVLGGDYLRVVREWTVSWWQEVRFERAYWWWIPTIFLHAGPGHLFRNMVSLLAGAGAVEFLMGRRWAYAVYGITGVAGMWLSYAGHGRPSLSIGASGAVFGLVGCATAFILRRRTMFTYRQRWKARRVYVPLFVALFIPSLLHADYYAHTGGLVSGILLGLVLPPHRRVRELAAVDPMEDPAAAGDTG